MSDAESTQALIERSNALIAQVEQQLAQRDDYYRDQGLDPEKVRQVLESHTDLRTIEAAQKAFEADMAEAEQYAHEEMARQSFARTQNMADIRPMPGQFV